MKREYQKLQVAEQRLSDTAHAASAVTHIENSIGFDPGSIAKMVDFVKTAAIKDVKLSKETIDKDKETLKKIQGGDKISKKTIIPESAALEHAQTKLKIDESVLSDAEDRLGKIKKMEMIVTEIEVAKYYATQTASTEMFGEKRTLENLKRNDVVKPK